MKDTTLFEKISRFSRYNGITVRITVASESEGTLEIPMDIEGDTFFNLLSFTEYEHQSGAAVPTEKDLLILDTFSEVMEKLVESVCHVHSEEYIDLYVNTESCIIRLSVRQMCGQYIVTAYERVSSGRGVPVLKVEIYDFRNSLYLDYFIPEDFYEDRFYFRFPEE